MAATTATISTEAFMTSAKEQPVDLQNLLKAELEAFYLYTAMELYFDSLGLNGFSNFAKAQAAEELSHYQKHLAFIKKKGIKVNLMAINNQNSDFESPQDAINQALKHEEALGAIYISAFHQANDAKDISLGNHLNWFVEEQDEEVAKLSNLVQRLKLAANDNGLLFIDQQL